MSVAIPLVEAVFGSVTPPLGDILALSMHLGCTKEISDFECLLPNFDQKYTVTNLISVGDDALISVGRGTNCPLYLTGRVEEVAPESNPVGHFMWVRGRCLGERLFRRVVTKTYKNIKGEVVVKNLIDIYTSDFGDDFDRGQLGDDWTIHSGTWGIENNQCYGDAGATTVDHCSAGADTKRTILKAKFKITEYSWEAGVCVRFQDPDNHYFVSLRSASHSLPGIFLYRRKLASNTHFANNQSVTILDNTEYEIRVEVQHENGGVRFKIYLDNTLAINYWNSIEDFDSGKIALRVKEGTKCYFDDVSQNALGHIRGTTELIENTDTTYTLLKYEDTPVFDILKYIAETADKSGVIGFDFRVEYDGKFAFFPRNSKTSPISLSEKLEYSRYSKDIHRIRNKIKVKGAAEKPYPLDTDGQPWSDSLTEDLTKPNNYLQHADGKWQPVTGYTNLYIETSTVHTGSKCVKARCTQHMYYMGIEFLFDSDKYVDCNRYPKLFLTLREDNAHDKRVTITLEDKNSNTAIRELSIKEYDNFETSELGVGERNQESWSIGTSFDWENVKKVRLDFHQNSGSYGTALVDRMHFGGGRWEHIEQVASSDVREYAETDEELHSDHECELRAKALLDYLKDPAEHITAGTTVLDYGTDRLQPADKIHITLPNENVDADFRILPLGLLVSGEDQTLEITLELGKEKPLLADYLYGLRPGGVTLESLARTKAGGK